MIQFLIIHFDNKFSINPNNHQLCPAPAMCVKLGDRLRDVENKQLAQTSAGWGVWKTLSVIAAIAAAAPLSVAAVVEVIKLMHP